MGKWLAGIVAAVIIGAITWILTNKLLPAWFAAPTVEKKYAVECLLNPPKVSPGQSTEVMVKITRDNEPLEGVGLEIGAGGGSFGPSGTTVSGYTPPGGIFRATWAPPPTARGLAYVFNVTVNGIQSTELALNYNRTGAHAQCHLTVGG